MNNRLFKQIAYGAVYILFLVTIVFGLRSLSVKQAPTCIDGVKNRDEVEVDCGGSYCQSCEIKRLLPIQLSQVVLLPSSAGGGTTALVEIQNKNPAFGTPKLSYVVRFYGSSTEPLYEEADTVAVYPSEVKYRLFVNAPVDFSQVVKAVATTTLGMNWQPITDFSRPKTPLRDVKLEYAPETLRGTVRGYIKNDNAFAIRRATINALLLNKGGTVVAASKTFVQDLIVGEERFFQIDVRLPSGVDPQELLDPKISLDTER